MSVLAAALAIMEIRVHDVQAQSPPGGWQNHEFEYDSSGAMFRCINCGRPEIECQ